MSTLKELRLKHGDVKSSIELNTNLLCKLVGFDNPNFTDEEINQVEDFYVKNHTHIEKLNISIDEFRNYFFAYCYKAFLKSNGGDLILDENKKSISFGRSIIVNYGGNGYPWVGISIESWIKRLEEGRFKGRLSEVINRNLIN